MVVACDNVKAVAVRAMALLVVGEDTRFDFGGSVLADSEVEERRYIYGWWIVDNISGSALGNSSLVGVAFSLFFSINDATRLGLIGLCLKCRSLGDLLSKCSRGFI